MICSFLIIDNKNITQLTLEMAQSNESSIYIARVAKTTKDFLYGGASGAIAKTITAPFERVKLLILSQQYNPELFGQPYRGFTNCLVRQVNQKGLLSLWSGNWTNMLRFFPTQAINFLMNDALNGIFLKGVDFKTSKQTYFTMSYLSGGISGCIGLKLFSPFDYPHLRIKLSNDQINTSQTKQSYGMFRSRFVKILNIEKFKRPHQGFVASLLSQFVYRGFYFGAYSFGKRYFWEPEQGQKNLSILHRLLLAYAVVFFSQTLVYPIQTIKGRLMMEIRVPFSQKTYKGILDCARKILQNEGVSGLFKGNFPSLLRSIRSLAPSITLVLYDELQTYFTQRIIID